MWDEIFRENKIDIKAREMKPDMDYEWILNTGMEILAQRDRDTLPMLILERSMEITRCDAGILYMAGEGGLEYRTLRIRQRKSIENVTSFLCVNDDCVSAYTAANGECVNIPDIDKDSRFDYEDVRRLDSYIGNRITSLLSVPIETHTGELVGVLILLNAADEAGRTVPFEKNYQMAVYSMASMAAVEWSNLSYTEELKALLCSFVEAFATAVDERTPYNGTHTRKVAGYAALLADYINIKHDMGKCEEYFDKDRREKLVLAALLHDIGKMIIPLSIMNRSSRMDGYIEQIEKRFELIGAYYEIDMLKGRITQEEYRYKCTQLEKYLELIHRIDEMNELDEETCRRIEDIAAARYVKPDNTPVPYLTQREIQCLSIRRGTLTEEDREQMENHVVMTAKILSKVHFNGNYSMIPRWAARHHELLDGSGYPEHLTKQDIELETRILTTADIYDALTAEDRPYKKPVPPQEAIEIMRDMAREGKLEMRLTDWLWEALNRLA